MSLRSLLLFVLFAALAAADALYSWWSYVNVTKLCALDAPAVCVYVPRLGINATDFSKTWTYIGDNINMRLTRYNPYDFDLLQFVVRLNAPQSVSVNVPTSGYIYAATSGFSVNGMTADQLNICGISGYGVYVSAGRHTVSSSTRVPLPLYFLDRNCVRHRLGDRVSNIQNATALNKTAVTIFYMPTAREKKTTMRLSFYYDIFNGSAHVYVVAAIYFDIFLTPVGRGFYIINGTAADAVVASEAGYWYFYGPVAFDLWRNATFNTGGSGDFRLYSIGPAPGDGIVRVLLPNHRNATVAYLSDGAAGYAKIERALGGGGAGMLKIYAGRYALVEVAVATADGRMYGTRTLACPTYNPTPTTSRLPIAIMNLTRLDRAKEVEICNHNAYTVYVGLYLSGTSPATYVHIDAIEPGACRRLRWDGALPNAATQLRVFRNATAVCNGWVMFHIPGQNYTAGWRYFLVGNRLVRDSPIDPDALYAEVWTQIMQTLAQIYGNMTSAFLQWLKTAANATAAGTATLQSIISSRPQFLGTIRMDSATSTWLRTVLNELQKWHVAGAPAGGAVSVRLQAPSALTASAAAAAVATAWAASRRSLATAAFLAGFAILATALFTAALYGTTVTAALVTVGVMLMAVGAAAAWMRQTGEE